VEAYIPESFLLIGGMEGLRKVGSINLLQPQSEETGPRRVTREERHPVSGEDESLGHRNVRRQRSESGDGFLDGGV